MGIEDDILTQFQNVADAAGQVGAATGAPATDAAAVPAPSARAMMGTDSRTLDVIMDVMLQVTVEVGKARMTIQDLLQLGQGSVVELEKLAGEALDIYINGKQVARGEAVIVNEKFGVKLTEIISQHERVDTLKK